MDKTFMDLRFVIKRTKDLTAAEQHGVNTVAGLAFAGDTGGQGFTWAGGDWQLMGSREDMIATSLGVVERNATVGGSPVRLGGIGGVATHPEWQRHGYGAALMHEANDFLRNELKVDFGLLVCSEKRSHFYVGLGWQIVKGPLMVDQPSGKVELKAVTMILPCTQENWPDGVIDLCGLPW